MSERLDSYSDNHYSQFGEDGCIAHIFDKIGIRSQIAVEFGAGDGLSCSNTASLWMGGWKAVLVECDQERYDALKEHTRGLDTLCLHETVASTGPKSITSLIASNGVSERIDFMSIDVDGIDYAIFQNLECQPRVLAVEFNPTIPPHIELHQLQQTDSLGASLAALIALANQRSYRFIGATYCNAFFVAIDEATPFDNYEVRPAQLCRPESYTYLVTDFGGRALACGAPLPWKVTAPYVMPVKTNATVEPITDDPGETIRGFEQLWGQSIRLDADGFAAASEDLSMAEFRDVLRRAQPQLVCIDVKFVADMTVRKWARVAESTGYMPVRSGPILGLIWKGWM